MILIDTAVSCSVQSSVEKRGLWSLVEGFYMVSIKLSGCNALMEDYSEVYCTEVLEFESSYKVIVLYGASFYCFVVIII